MKTPMQEMLEYVHDEVQLFGSARQILISKIKEMIEKEKDEIIDAYNEGQESKWGESMGLMGDHYYDETFKTK